MSTGEVVHRANLALITVEIRNGRHGCYNSVCGKSMLNIL